MNVIKKIKGMLQKKRKKNHTHINLEHISEFITEKQFIMTSK